MNEQQKIDEVRRVLAGQHEFVPAKAPFMHFQCKWCQVQVSLSEYIALNMNVDDQFWRCPAA